MLVLEVVPMDELSTFEGQVAMRAFRHSVGRLPRWAEEEEHRRLEAARTEARRRWRELRSERRTGPRRSRHAA